MKRLTVYDTLRMVEESAEPLAFLNVDTGKAFQSRKTPSTTLFDATGLTVPLTRGQYIAINGRCEMEQAAVGVVAVAVADDEEDFTEYPDDSDLLDWANNLEEVTDEEVQAFVVDVMEEDNRERSRATNIKKIEKYLET